MKNIINALIEYFAPVEVLGLLQKEFTALMSSPVSKLSEVISTWVIDCAGKDVLFMGIHPDTGYAYVYHVRMCKTAEGNDHQLYVERINEGNKLLPVNEWEVTVNPVSKADFRARINEGWQFYMTKGAFTLGHDKVLAFQQARKDKYEQYKADRAEGKAKPF